MDREILLFEYMERVQELRDIVANQIERIANLEAIVQTLADELMAHDDILDDVIVEYRHALDELEIYENEAHLLGNPQR